MQSLPKRRLNLTSTLPRPNRYTTALQGEFSHVAFSEERAPGNKGQWRARVFSAPAGMPMDVEIGTGNGFHFGHRAIHHPDRLIVGLEIKYKPLFQAIRRAIVADCKNAAICRYHAFNLTDLFADGEIDDVYIHFPDPWTSPKKPKNRIVNREMLALLHRMQRPGSKIEFKTDSREMYLWALREIAESPYDVEFETGDFHASERAGTGFITFFERIFMNERIPINYVRLVRRSTTSEPG